jgi:hypothetical protein
MTLPPELIRFFKRLIIFSLMQGAAAGVLYLILPAKAITPAMPFLFFFFTAVTFLNYWILIRSTARKFIRFVNYYLLSTTVKLLLFIGVLVGYILLNRADAVPFGISFFILYLLYTIFEVIELIRYSKEFRS